MKRFVIIQNGLGNQMFCYAFYLAIRKHYPNVSANSYMCARKGDHNGYELKRLFGIHCEDNKLSNYIIRFYRKIYYTSLRQCRARRLTVAIIKILYYLSLGLYIEKPGISFHENRLNVLSKRYKIYWGGWMTDKWFAETEDEIRSTFRFNMNMLCKQTQTTLQEILSLPVQSVSIHIRRGDYLYVDEYAGMCDISYYKRAIEIISQKVTSLCFYVFSDDIDWVKSNLTVGHATISFIDWNSRENSWQDMLLMSACKHNIIANSTFSWWGAWLNKNPEKIVICPKQFSKLQDSSNIMPDNWIRI